MKAKVLVCPNCKNTLSAQKFNMCNFCGEKQKLVDKGVYSFLKDNYYWGEIPPADMQKVLLDSRKNGWKNAVQDLVKTYPKMEEYLLNHARIDWIFHCLPLTAKGRALDIGSGWGGLAFDLTNFFDEVYSLEAVFERFEFQHIRKSQEKVKKLTVVQGNFLKLPFADNSFDLVAVNGVMEWAGIADYSKSAPEVQRDFLKEIYRVLKPGGVVYIGIENRFGLHYLLGAEDHSGLPFTSMMPRFLADITVRFLRKTEGRYKLRIRMNEDWENYRTYTYTLNGYKKLLASCNFSKVNPYWTLFYSNPKFSGPVDGISFKFFLKYITDNTSGGKKSVGGLISKFGNLAPEWLCKQLAMWFAPSFLIYAYKDSANINFESKIKNFAKPHKSFLKMGGSSGETSKVNYFFLNSEKLVEVAKFARFSKADKLISLESKKSTMYGNIKISKTRKVNQRLIFYEKPILEKHLNPNNLDDVNKSLDWLFEFQDKTAIQKNFIREMQRNVDYLYTLVPKLKLKKNQERIINSQLTQFGKLIDRVYLPSCFTHGDFCARNILVGENGISILDWEDFEEKSEPLLDFMFFVIHSLAHLDNSRNIVKSINNYESNKFLKFCFNKFSKKYKIDENVLQKSLAYISLCYLDKFWKDNKHLGHGNFYISILRHLK